MRVQVNARNRAFHFEADKGEKILYAGLRASYDRTIPRARQVLLASVVYLPVLYGLLVLDGNRY